MRAALPFVVLLALLAAGCGSGRLSHNEFVSRADQICARSQDAIRKLQPPTTSSQAAAYLRKQLKIEQQALASIRRLKAPESDKRKVNELLQEFDRLDQLAAQAANALDQKNQKNFIKARAAAAEALLKVNGAAQGLGLNRCGAVQGAG
jgi:hypothetical protein